MFLEMYKCRKENEYGRDVLRDWPGCYDQRSVRVGLKVGWKHEYQMKLTRQ